MLATKPFSLWIKENLLSLAGIEISGVVLYSLMGYLMTLL
jgi:hypothetical protein